MIYYGSSIKIKNIELSIEFDGEHCFMIPYIWKIWPPMNEDFGNYYGHTWAVQFNWLWFTFGINNLK